jgi:hypothetical protein
VRTIARFLLWILTSAIPVFLAACYGAPYGYSKNGRVIDSESKEGISGIKVICSENGNDWNYSYSWTDGYFNVDYDVPCDKLVLVDEDGLENGGFYPRRVVPFDEDCDEITVEMTRDK